MHHQGKTAHAELREQLFEVPDAIVGPKEDVRRLVGKAAPHVIGHDHPVLVSQGGDDVSEQEAPGWVAVQADDHGAAALVDVVHAVAVLSAGGRAAPHRDEPRPKGVEGPEWERWATVVGLGCGHGEIMGPDRRLPLETKESRVEPAAECGE